MKTVFDHIDHIKGQPHHIRKQVAFASAGALTIVIALTWFVGSLATGTFAIRDTSFTSSGQIAPVTADGGANQNLAGAGAAAALPQNANVPAHIEIIDATPAASSERQAEQTTIPF